MTQEEQQRLLQRITYNPGIFGGKPIIRGIRFAVTDILELLTCGASHEEIIEDFPFLEEDDIRAALLICDTSAQQFTPTKCSSLSLNFGLTTSYRQFLQSGLMMNWDFRPSRLLYPKGVE